jgi:hypothetical protein
LENAARRFSENGGEDNLDVRVGNEQDEEII